MRRKHVVYAYGTNDARTVSRPVRAATVLGTVLALVTAMALPAMAAPNPPLPSGNCGLTVAVVLDVSDSITAAGAEQAVRDATSDLVNYWNASDMTVGLFRFWDEAEFVAPYTPTSTGAAALDAAAQTLVFAPGTNWEAGFIEVYNYDGSPGPHWSAPPTSSPLLPDAVVFVTDGLPTAYVDDAGNAVTGAPTATAQANGEAGADLFRANGVKVIALGIGSVSVASLQGISGPVETEDYWLADFATLSDQLLALGTTLCDPNPPPPATANVAIVKSAGDVEATPGEQLTYTLAVSNAGPDAATDVVVVDTVPAGTVFASATATVGSCSEAAGTVTCDLGDVAIGETPTVTLTVTLGPATAGVLSNTASVSTAAVDPEAANNVDTEDTPVVDVLPATGIAGDVAFPSAVAAVVAGLFLLRITAVARRRDTV
ncbi:MAG: DUF11 domain-containing protein [Acidimicrobiia bacterium]|nr:DUF11 domain-containing protein [Acidimicrobiia bacterium]